MYVCMHKLRRGPIRSKGKPTNQPGSGGMLLRKIFKFHVAKDWISCGILEDKVLRKMSCL